ncbi:hypothetical protein L249_6046, partial [Ophiocordyceps polyrhachis-furcata BCC 54312]
YIACGYFPARYKESNIIVLRKAGKSLEVLRTPRGYRPILLLNTLTTLIRSYLTSCSSRLKVDGRLSKPFDIERGAPRGTRPTLLVYLAAGSPLALASESLSLLGSR